MMIAVDRGRCTCQRRKARDTAHPMAAAAVPFDVLPERAAEKDIDRLHTAADAKDGLAEAEKGVEQRLLLLVPYRVDGQAAVLHRLPVARRVEIPATGEQQAVAARRKAGGVTAAGEHADTAGKRQAFAVQRGLLPLHGQIACNAPCRNENHGMLHRIALLHHFFVDSG